MRATAANAPAHPQQLIGFYWDEGGLDAGDKSAVEHFGAWLGTSKT
jgi:hypothetical protein